MIANDPLRDFVLPIFTILGSAGNHKLGLPPGNSGLLMSRDKQTEGRVNILVGITDPDQQREVGQQVYMTVGRNMCGIQIIYLRMSSYLLNYD